MTAASSPGPAFSRREFIQATALASGALLAGCAVNPVTGEQQLMLLGQSDEIQIDRANAPHQLSSDYGISQDSRLVAYLDGFGRRMAAQTHRSSMPYRFVPVNAAYVNPPVSTEQILHPERYPDDMPVEVTLPDVLPVLGEGWELLDSDTLGEFYTYLLLSAGVDPKARIADDVAQKAAAGWGGDRFDVYHNKATGQTVLVLKSQWDSSGDAVEFATQLKKHVLARFDLGDELTEIMAMFIEMGLGHAQLQQVGDTVYYVLSPSEEISLAVLDAVME